LVFVCVVVVIDHAVVVYLNIYFFLA